ncbi:MAG: hypothetical protein LBU32_04110 [Clostridiales bacterium]|jgi:hypothetical protein|nr:hypothetical protein [Clostridiales bacterium]
MAEFLDAMDLKSDADGAGLAQPLSHAGFWGSVELLPWRISLNASPKPRGGF